MRRAGFALLTATLLCAAFVPAARADRARLRDGNDARGPLDIARISHGHRGNRLVHTIRLRGPWPAKKLRHRGFAHVYFELRGHPGNPPERTVQIVYERGELVARMYNSLGDPPRHVRRVALRRPDRRTVRVLFPAKLLRRGLQRYKWNTVTFVESGHDLCRRRSGCVDWGPDLRRRGFRYVEHVL